MIKNDGIAYEKPALLKYGFYGIVNGESTGLSKPVDDPGDTEICDDFTDNE